MFPCVSTIINIHLRVNVINKQLVDDRGVENTKITEDTDVISVCMLRVWLADV